MSEKISGNLIIIGGAEDKRGKKEILKKASEILNDLGARLWQNVCDDDGVFFSDLGGGIENALEGDYQMP